MTTAIANPLDADTDRRTRALCASDPEAFDYDKSTPLDQVFAAQVTCYSCPVFRRCAELLAALPDELVPRGTPGRIRTCDTGFNSRRISTIAVGSRLLLQDNGIRVLTRLVSNRGFASILGYK